MIKQIIRKSCYGQTYSIPENQLNHFKHLDEAIENAEFGSDEEQNAIDEFVAVFAEYAKDYA